jgi:hypothetical protein
LCSINSRNVCNSVWHSNVPETYADPFASFARLPLAS